MSWALRICPGIGQDDRHHLLARAIAHAQAPRAGACGSVKGTEEGGARAAPARGQRGRRGQAGAAPVLRDAQMEMPAFVTVHLHADVAVEQRDSGGRGKASLEARALDARTEDHLAPLLLEA